MYRTRRMNAVRLALSASLLSATAFAYAGPAQSADDNLWTRVDLEDVPKVVSPAKGKAKPNSPAAAKPVVGKAAAPALKAEPVAPTKATGEKNSSGALASAVTTSETASPSMPVVSPKQPTLDASAGPVVPAPVKADPVKLEPVKADVVKVEQRVAEPAKVAPPPKPTFALNAKDRVIRTGVERWAAAAGWKLSWELADGAAGGVVKFDADFGTDFDVALSKLATAMRGETRVHAYLYAENKVLRIIEEEARPPVSPVVPMTPTIRDVMLKDLADRGLPYVTRVKGYWLGASGTETEDAPPQKLPTSFESSVSLVFSDKANMATVIGILSKVTGVAIMLPGAIEYPAATLFVNDKPLPTPGKKSRPTGKKTFVGTPRSLLDRISVSTGLLWEYKDETIVFTE